MSSYEFPTLDRTSSATPMMGVLPYVADKTATRHLGGAGGAHAKSYFNPATNSVNARYTHSDWSLSNNVNFSMSEKERAFAEKVRADAWQTVKETDAQTRNRQTDVTKRLGDRVYDIAFWKTELNNEISAMATETENLKEYKRTLERALADTANPLHVAEECLMHREKRQGIDLVNDKVEKSLVKEVDVIRKCQTKMKQVLEKAFIQIKMNRAAQHAMEIDAKDKHHAQNLDDRMQQLKNSSAGIGYYPGIEAIDNTITLPASWAQYTQQNIARSQKERASSEKLRGAIDTCLRECATNMWSNFNTVNNNFNTRIRESEDARNKLQAHLQRTMQEIFDMEKNIELLRKAIKDKEAPMKVSQSRLDERTRRINVELCNDPVMISLQNEVREIRESVRILKERLKTSEMSLARLMKTKATLEHDISVKENSLRIDSQWCMGMRKGFPMDPKVGPIFQMPTC
ncbi:tektin-3-like [Haliotis asinina]|uniref:tektin-3-like n=1 Tax=Haliotis asinina TaxID=109174 RepID=UPI003531C5FB